MERFMKKIFLSLIAGFMLVSCHHTTEPVQPITPCPPVTDGFGMWYEYVNLHYQQRLSPDGSKLLFSSKQVINAVVVVFPA